jgi:sodium-dependent phosphate cotransporter
MTLTMQPPREADRPAPGSGFIRALALIALLYVFLVGVKGLGAGFMLLGRDTVDAMFTATTNPFVGLMVGILATTLVQSSSVSTAMIVGLVAAPENPLPVMNAVPMIMGANIGTTVTNTIVSLGHMRQREEFVRAFAVATCHDFFNFITVALLLPLELMTGFLSRSALFLSSRAEGMAGVEYESPIESAAKLGLEPLQALAQSLFTTGAGAGVMLLLLSGVLIYATLMMIVKVMRTVMESRMESFVTRSLGRSILLSVFVGMVATVMVQSSSITTSLMVPLAGAGLLRLEHAFPVTVGANLGTTVTAMLASMAASGANAQHGLTIALVHLFFNVSGALIILPFARIRNIPIALARWLARATARSRLWAVAYVVGLFYMLPALLAVVNRLF